MKLTDDERLYGKWHVLALDNWYTRIGAVNEVFNSTKRMHVVGTIKTNKKGLPTSSVMKPSKTSGDRRGVMVCRYHKIKKINFIVWRDNKRCPLGRLEKQKFCAMERMQRETFTDLVWTFQLLSLCATLQWGARTSSTSTVRSL